MDITNKNASRLEKVIVVSTRVPDPNKPFSGGMAPSVKASCALFGQAVWYGVGKNDAEPCCGQLSAEFTTFTEIGQPAACYTRHGIEIKRLQVDRHEWDGHYNRFSNEFLWPLFHDRPDLMRTPGNTDVIGNGVINNLLARQIAAALRNENDTTTPIWIHDYHHMNLPALLRMNDVQNPIVFFNHTPLPAMETLQEIGEEARSQYISYIKELRHGDALLFQSEITAKRFMQALGLQVHSLGPFETVDYMIEGSPLTVGNFPISIHTQEILEKAIPKNLVSDSARSLQSKLVADNIFIDFSRADYSKGLVERIRAFEKLLDERSDLKGKVQLVIGAEPSRTDIPAYQNYAKEVQALATTVNSRTDLWIGDKTPIVLLPEHVPHEDVIQMFRNNRPGQRKIGTITAFRDGMNLVAKEFIMAQDPENAGVLLLSNGTGAGHETDFSQYAVTYTPNLHDDKSLIEAMAASIDLSQDRANSNALVAQGYLKVRNLDNWACRTVDVMERISTDPFYRPANNAGQISHDGKNVVSYSTETDIQSVLNNLHPSGTNETRPIAVLDMDGNINIGYVLNEGKVLLLNEEDDPETQTIPSGYDAEELVEQGLARRTLFAAKSNDARIAPELVAKINEQHEQGDYLSICFLTSRRYADVEFILRESGINHPEKMTLVADSGNLLHINGEIRHVKELTQEETAFIYGVESDLGPRLNQEVKDILREEGLNVNGASNLFIEPKGTAINLHYRGLFETLGLSENDGIGQKIVMHLQTELQNYMGKVPQERDGTSVFKLGPGPMTFEIKLASITKATGMQAIVEEIQNAGRNPDRIIFAGDDCAQKPGIDSYGTDHSAMEWVNANLGSRGVVIHTHHPLNNEFQGEVADPAKRAPSGLKIDLTSRSPMQTANFVVRAISLPEPKPHVVPVYEF